MRYFILKIILLFFFISRASASEVIASEVYAKKIHLSYLNGHHEQMLLLIKEALLAHPYDVSLKENLIDLFAKASQRFVLKPDWVLPKDISTFEVSTTRKSFSNDLYWEYKLSFYIHTQPHKIKSFSLHSAQGTTVLISSNTDSSWEEGYIAHGDWGVIIGKNLGKTPLSSGLYFFDLVFTDSSLEKFSGWFILPQSIPDEFPSVVSPKVDQVYYTDKPTFEWNDDVFTKQNLFARASTAVNILTQSCDDTPSVFDFYAPHPKTILTLGPPLSDSKFINLKNLHLSHAQVINLFKNPQLVMMSGTQSLFQGKYFFYLTQRLSQDFGKMKINVNLQNIIPFRVELKDMNKQYDCSHLPEDYVNPI